MRLIEKVTILTALAAALAPMACGPDNVIEPNPYADVYIWVADQPNKRVLIFNETGKLIKELAAPGQFSKPNALDNYAAAGSFWVCDFYTNRIKKFTAAGELLYASPAEEENLLVRNATSLSVAQTSGECWVADRGNHRVLRLGADGEVLARITGFHFPRAVAVDPRSGDCWVTDEGNDAVVKISASASGNVGFHNVEIFSYHDLPKPWAAAADASGAGWVSSLAAGKVIKINKEGQMVAEVAGFGMPIAVAVDEVPGHVYVADAEKGKVVCLPRNLTGSYDNFAAAATFVIAGLKDPEYIFVDDYDNRFYVAEMGNDTVRVYDAEGNEELSFPAGAGPAAVAAWHNK